MDQIERLEEEIRMLRLLIEEELDWDEGDVNFWISEKRKKEEGEDTEGRGNEEKDEGSGQ